MARARIGFIEIPARDAERLARFLSAVFGWSTSRKDWTDGIYLALEDAVGEVGCGLVEAGRSRLDAPTPVVHMDPDDFEHCLRRVVSAGGAVVEVPRPVDDLGVFARFGDTEGNVWGLWAPAAGRTGQAGG